MPYIPTSTSIHEEIHTLASTEDSSREFLTNVGILMPFMTCSCSSLMDVKSCATSKSADLYLWRCPTCRKTKNIRSDSILAGSKISFKLFLTLIYYFSCKSLTNVDVAGFIGLGEKSVGKWRSILSCAIVDWFLNG